MNALHDDWKSLKQQMGAFTNRIEGMIGGASDIEEVKQKAYDKGKKDAEKQEAIDYCKDCRKDKFFKECNGWYQTIDSFNALSYEQKQTISDLIFLMRADRKID